jgi:molecular chaperone GrpE
MSKKEKITQEEGKNDFVESSPSEENGGQESPQDKADILEDASSFETKLKEQEEKYLRLYAEFDNFRRRNAKERLELIQQAGGELIRLLLPVLDDLDRSLKASEQNSEGLREGIELVNRKFIGLLESKGLKKMEAKGLEFDSELHEAITQIPVSDDSLKGKIVEVVEDGYLLNDKVIRYAKVIIGAQ